MVKWMEKQLQRWNVQKHIKTYTKCSNFASNLEKWRSNETFHIPEIGMNSQSEFTSCWWGYLLRPLMCHWWDLTERYPLENNLVLPDSAKDGHHLWIGYPWMLTRILPQALRFFTEAWFCLSSYPFPYAVMCSKGRRCCLSFRNGLGIF